MANLTEAQVIRLMRDEYHRRLIETIDEAEMFDDKGNSLLSKGLKVRHKDSGLEYTVDSVEGEKDSGDVKVKLRLPDEPRFQPPSTPSSVISDETSPASFLGEIELDPNDLRDPQEIMPRAPTDDLADDESFPEDEETEFVIDQEEFEKEYEVN